MMDGRFSKMTLLPKQFSACQFRACDWLSETTAVTWTATGLGLSGGPFYTPFALSHFASAILLKYSTATSRTSRSKCILDCLAPYKLAPHAFKLGKLPSAVAGIPDGFDHAKNH